MLSFNGRTECPSECTSLLSDREKHYSAVGILVEGCSGSRSRNLAFKGSMSKVKFLFCVNIVTLRVHMVDIHNLNLCAGQTIVAVFFVCVCECCCIY